MNARNFFMTASGRSQVRSSSYENQPRDDGAAPAPSADAPATATRGALARLASGTVVAVAALLAACGSLPTNVGKTDSSALAPDPESPLVKIAQASTPSAEQTGVRLLPLGAYSLDTRIQLAQRATR